MTGGITHTGWKAIAKRLGVRTIDTAKVRVRKFKIPVVKLGNAVALDEAVYCAWYQNLVEVSQENDIFKKPGKFPRNSPQTSHKIQRPE